MMTEQNNDSIDEQLHHNTESTQRQFPKRSRATKTTRSTEKYSDSSIENPTLSTSHHVRQTIPQRSRNRRHNLHDSVLQADLNPDSYEASERRSRRRIQQLRNPVTRTGIRIPIKWVLVAVLVVISLLILGFIFTRSNDETAPNVQSHTSTGEVQQLPLEVSGRLGAPIRINPTDVLTVRDVGKYTLIEGDGRKIAAGGPVYVKVSTFDAATGKLSGADAVTRVGPATAELLPTDLYETIVGVHEGTRLALVRNVTTSDSTHLEVSVVDILPTVATGTSMSAPADAQAWVTVKAGIPEIVDVKSAEETKPWGHTVIRGNGDQIPEGATIIAQFLMMDANTKTLVESTWEAGSMPTRIDLKKAMQPLATELVDQPVGSRIVVTIPAAQANGNNPVVVVVDVLGIAQEEKK